jgi:23S rRNA (cytosine1962-C5)-methyltransferase
MAPALNAAKKAFKKPMLKILDKPPGCTTHTSLSADETKRLHLEPNDGFLEHLGYRSGKALNPVHRLDVGTSGVLLAVQQGNPDSAELTTSLANALESRDVKKTYYFVTDRKPRRGFESGTEIESHIARVKSGGGSQAKTGPQYVSHAATNIEPVNAVTIIELVLQHGSFALWKALPQTGKPHQIRLHAETAGLAILGDADHGGTAFPTLCLHAAELDAKVTVAGAPLEIKARSPLPRWFSDLELLNDRQLVSWLQAIERRERLHRSLRTMEVFVSETRREIHSDSILGGIDLRCDRLGEITHFHWYGNPKQMSSVFQDADLARVTKLAGILKLEDWYLQHRSNRGAGGRNLSTGSAKEETALSKASLPVRWIANEEEMRFQFRRDSGLSPGLFLDQRANRRWVLQNSPRRVLNLFSYTGGFSVAAARAGAELVVSVDLSRAFLEWTKDNFILNNLDPLLPKYEFRAMDSREYLKWAAKKNLQFDLVVCDPPSFSRSDSGVFRIETELESLLAHCTQVTAPGGRILISTNYETWTHQEFVQRTTKFANEFARQTKKLVTLERTPSPDWDFEMPREPRRMKSLFIKIDQR